MTNALRKFNTKSYVLCREIFSEGARPT